MDKTMTVRIHGVRFNVQKPFDHFGHTVKLQADDKSFYCDDCGYVFEAEIA